MKNTPVGVFFREGRENGRLLLSFSIAKKQGKKNALCKRNFASCGFSSAKLNWRPVALSSSAAQPWTPAAFEKAAKAFNTGLIYGCFGFVPTPGGVLFLFCNDSEI